MKERAHRFDRLLQFQSRNVGHDGYGNDHGDFETLFLEPSCLMYRRGGEVALGARLRSEQPVIVKFRRNERTALVDENWRAIEGDQQFEFRERPTISQDDRRYYEVLAIAKART